MSQMVSAENAREVFAHNRCDGDVGPRLRVLRYENVFGAKGETAHLPRRRGGRHEVEGAGYQLVVVDVGVVAEAYDLLRLQGFLVHIAELGVRDILEPLGAG